MVDEAQTSELLKRLTVLGPLFASSVAVCYDVGFFYGLNIAFFTFFTLAEHFVFALQSVPFAIVPVFWVTTLVFSHRLGFQLYTKEMNNFREQLPNLGSDARLSLLTKLNRKIRWNKIVDAIVHAAFAALIVWLAFGLHKFQLALWLAIVLVANKLVYPPDKLQLPERRYGILAFSIAMSWLMAFAIGYERAEDVKKSPASEMISTDAREIPARIVRGGDRGVLLVATDNKQLHFLRWDAIKKIETIGP